MTGDPAPAKASAPHIAIRPEWLALQREAPLDPGLPIVDAHHHLWRFPDKVYEAGDLIADMADGPRITSTVFVECKTGYRTDGPDALRSVGEMEFVNRQRDDARARGAAADIAAASVGYADLSLGDSVSPVLDALVKRSGGRLRSVRNISVWHADPAVRASAATPPPRLLSNPAFREGLRCLIGRGLAFDAWLVHTQLEELHDLARAFPSASFVLNHVGGPLALGPYATQRAEVFAAWREQMRQLAHLPNVAVKIGGFGMPLFGFGFASRETPPDSATIAVAIAPYVDACIDAFGADRCMLESNFPVDKGSFNYNTLWNAFKRVTRKRSDREIELLFGGTATQFYQLAALPS
jgi:predicted TIM-barrel fold metal-dependent hydrolase